MILNDNSNGNTFTINLSTGRYVFYSPSTDDQFVGTISARWFFNPAREPECNFSYAEAPQRGNFFLLITGKACLETGTVEIRYGTQRFTINDTNGQLPPPPPPDPIPHTIRVAESVLIGAAINKPQPTYPQAATPNSGNAVVEVLVGTNGIVEKTTVLSATHDAFRLPAEATARQWTFNMQGFQMNGVVTKVLSTLTFNFVYVIPPPIPPDPPPIVNEYDLCAIDDNGGRFIFQVNTTNGRFSIVKCRKLGGHQFELTGTGVVKTARKNNNTTVSVAIPTLNGSIQFSGLTNRFARGTFFTATGERIDIYDRTIAGNKCSCPVSKPPVKRALKPAKKKC